MLGWNRWNNATAFLFISSGKSLLSLQQFHFGSCHHFTVSVYSFWHLQSIFHPEFPLFMQFSNVILQLTQYDAVCGSLFPSWSLSIGRIGGGGEGGRREGEGGDAGLSGAPTHELTSMELRVWTGKLSAWKTSQCDVCGVLWNIRVKVSDSEAGWSGSKRTDQR